MVATLKVNLLSFSMFFSAASGQASLPDDNLCMFAFPFLHCWCLPCSGPLDSDEENTTFIALILIMGGGVREALNIENQVEFDN